MGLLNSKDAQQTLSKLPLPPTERLHEEELRSKRKSEMTSSIHDNTPAVSKKRKEVDEQQAENMEIENNNVCFDNVIVSQRRYLYHC